MEEKITRILIGIEATVSQSQVVNNKSTFTYLIPRTWYEEEETVMRLEDFLVGERIP